MYGDGSDSMREIIEFADGIINWFRVVFEEHVSRRRFCSTDFVSAKRISAGGKEGKGRKTRRRGRRWEKETGEEKEKETARKNGRSKDYTTLPATTVCWLYGVADNTVYRSLVTCSHCMANTNRWRARENSMGVFGCTDFVFERRCKQNKIFSNFGRHKKFTDLENNDFETCWKSRPSTLRRTLTTIRIVVVSISCLSRYFASNKYSI